jgi:hypothetical protein
MASDADLSTTVLLRNEMNSNLCGARQCYNQKTSCAANCSRIYMASLCTGNLMVMHEASSYRTVMQLRAVSIGTVCYKSETVNATTRHAPIN